MLMHVITTALNRTVDPSLFVLGLSVDYDKTDSNTSLAVLPLRLCPGGHTNCLLVYGPYMCNACITRQ